MASYKVPQDVEAEDKLLGPLTLKQFIFAIITILLVYLAFTLGQANPLLVLPFLLPIALFGYLAAPFHRDQPTDVYLGARLRFLFKPRKRIWDQSGMEELVRITVPKKIEVQLTNNLDQSEVHSRLAILASTIDSRGWATKNAYVNEPTSVLSAQFDQMSDRLVGPQQLPQAVPDNDITAADDMLDPNNNRLAYHMDQLANQAKNQVREQAVAQMHQDTTGTQPDPGNMRAPAPQVIHPSAAQSEPTLNTDLDPEPMDAFLQANGIDHQYNPYPNQMRQRVLRPSSAPETPTSRTQEHKKQTTEDLPQSAKIGLAQRDDLNLDVISREADRVVHKDESGGDEVVINLH